jgi:hypothetical protein
MIIMSTSVRYVQYSVLYCSVFRENGAVKVMIEFI